MKGEAGLWDRRSPCRVQRRIMSYAWIAHKTEAFEAVEFIQECVGGKIEVRNKRGETQYIDPSAILGALDDASELYQSPDDLVMLDKIDEPSILQV